MCSVTLKENGSPFRQSINSTVDSHLFLPPSLASVTCSRLSRGGQHSSTSIVSCTKSISRILCPTPADNNITSCDVFAAFLALSQQCRHRKAGRGLHALPFPLQPVAILLALLFEVLEQGIAAQNVGMNKGLTGEG